MAGENSALTFKTDSKEAAQALLVKLQQREDKPSGLDYTIFDEVVVRPATDAQRSEFRQYLRGIKDELSLLSAHHSQAGECGFLGFGRLGLILGERKGPRKGVSPFL